MKKKGYIYIFIATIFFASSYIGLKYAFVHFKDLSPANASFWGMLGASLLGTPVFLRSKKSIKKLQDTIIRDGKILLLVSFITSFAAFLWFMALENTSLGPHSLLVKSSIVFAVILGVIFLKERIGSEQISGIALAITGIVLISTLAREVQLIYVMLVMLSSFIFALQSFFIRKYSPNINGKEFAYLRTILISLFLGSAFLIQKKLVLIPLDIFFVLSISVCMGALIGRALYFEAHKYLEISKLNIILLFEPVLLLTAGSFIFGEVISTKKITGAIFIILGLWLLVYRDFIRRKNKIEAL